MKTNPNKKKNNIVTGLKCPVQLYLFFLCLYSDKFAFTSFSIFDIL